MRSYPTRKDKHEEKIQDFLAEESKKTLSLRLYRREIKSIPRVYPALTVEIILQYKDDACERIEIAAQPPAPVELAPAPKPEAEAVKKVIKNYNRSVIFPAKQLESEADIDAYVEKVRTQLKQLLHRCDGIKLK